ncbi:DUF2299 family protein [Geoglobus acetivorans]|uniref:DUF2299 family protein n=1 Tax=Geoglobus acetivorans TaxID=565033 RepID=A0ABZ3H2J7_GEOAI|nr:DUF2299 family protein [Geoglobus acetivorans]
MNFKEMVKDWLVEEGFFREEVSDENADFHYVIEVPPGSNQVIDIIAPRDRDVILIASGIRLSDEHYSMVMAMDEKERRRFMWTIRFDLIFLQTEFQIIPDAMNPQLFQFTRKLYAENVTRQLLMDSISEVHKCKLYIIWRMRERFERSERRGDSEVMYL